MTTQLLTSELSNLIQESKRKNVDLRNAAEKSLADLKALPSTSESQLAADLRRRPLFVKPFLLACNTRNGRFAGNAIVCLQRLVVSHGLPKETLKDVLEAFRECTSLGLDIQLKLLQTLPSVLQNYSSSITGELLGSILQVCCLLHGSKTGVVSNTAAATLQQLVVSVLDNVAAEDNQPSDAATVAEVSTDKGDIAVRRAALDAYHLLNHLCLLTEGLKPDFLHTAPLPQSFGLELLETVLDNHAETVISHPEQVHILRVRLIPFIVKIISERSTFSSTVRVMRILCLIFSSLLTALASECEMVLSLLNHMLDLDVAVSWKRILCLEVWRSIHADPALIRTIYALYDEQESKRSILYDHLASLVRLAAEKPALIGLGHHSSAPSFKTQVEENSDEQVAVQAGGIAGTIGAGVGGKEFEPPGISTRWSTVRVRCLDQLDKTDVTLMPSTYIYGLALHCINSFSEGLAKFLLPLSLPSEVKSKKKQGTVEEEQTDLGLDGSVSTTLENQTSANDISKRQPLHAFKTLLNPLDLESHALYSQISTSSHIVDRCWPALLAVCSTFLNATLDSDYYHALVRSFQKFTQVAGLLRLSTPRDAFLTTLGKHAVPSALTTAHTLSSPVIENANQGRYISDRTNGDAVTSSSSGTPRQSIDLGPATLNTRNLLCLRALINLGIALGPTLQKAWSIILETLQNADLVISITIRSKQSQNGYSPKPTVQEFEGEPASRDNLGAEVTAVDIASSRMFESTVDLSDEAFLDILGSLCSLLRTLRSDDEEKQESRSKRLPPTRSASHAHRRLLSTSGESMRGESMVQADNFVLEKLSDLIRPNVFRMLGTGDAEKAWNKVTEFLIQILSSSLLWNDIRIKASQTLNKLIIAIISSDPSASSGEHDNMKKQALRCLDVEITSLYTSRLPGNTALHGCEIEIHQLCLRTLLSMLQQCNDLIDPGWDIVLAIILSIFSGDQMATEDSLARSVKCSYPSPRSPKLLRSSFESLQLICSDFLSSVPQSCFLTLLDTLYRFSAQQVDFNISLTTTTLFWDVSDYLRSKINHFHFDETFLSSEEEHGQGRIVNLEERNVSTVVLWLHLLLQLKTMTTDPRLEVRHGALHTLFRGFDACGEQFDPRAWSTCLDLVVFETLRTNEAEFENARSSKDSGAEEKPGSWNETATVLLHAVAKLFVQYHGAGFAPSEYVKPWQQLLQAISGFLNRKSLHLDTACFLALNALLSKIDSTDAIGIDVLDSIWIIWRDNNPVRGEDLRTSQELEDNQPALIAYLQSFRQIYRYLEPRVGLERIKTALEQLRLSAAASNTSGYTTDVDSLTPFQTEMIETIKSIKMDISGISSELIDHTAAFVLMPYHHELCESEKKRPTFVAFSKAAMELLKDQVVASIDKQEIYTNGSVTKALAALSRAISLKYMWTLEGKRTPTWKKATTCAQVLLEAAIPASKNYAKGFDVSSFWEEIVQVADGIISAPCSSCPSPSEILPDQDFDIAAFTVIRDLITPALGSPRIPERIHRAYAEHLFTNSLIHTPHPDDLPRPGQEPLANLKSNHIGRVDRLQPSPRKKMSYLLLDELFSLVAARPRESSSPEQVNLARAAAPYLILRAGVSFKAYVLDHPLRGLMPLPRSQKEELIWLLARLRNFKSEAAAVPEAEGVRSRERRHLHWLYPLVLKVGEVGWRDVEVSDAVRGFLESVGEGFGV